MFLSIDGGRVGGWEEKLTESGQTMTRLETSFIISTKRQ